MLWLAIQVVKNMAAVLAPGPSSLTAALSLPWPLMAPFFPS